MLPILILITALGQDGPVLAPPADSVAPAEPTRTVPESAPIPVRDRRGILRRILQPRQIAPRLEHTPSPPTSPNPNPFDSLAASEPDTLPEPLPVPPSSRNSPGLRSSTRDLDPLGLDELPPELQLQPALEPAATAPSSRSFDLDELPPELELQPALPSATPLRSNRPRQRSSARPSLETLPGNSLDTPSLPRDPLSDLDDSSAGQRRGSTRARPADNESDHLLERELRRAILTRLGRQVRAVDVRVRGEQISVHADVNFFWNRRPVRRAIESLPELAGYQLDISLY
ncbi:MAG: hypothetical protein KatS3mg108_1035 [Isosphaeraceae bacterium]|nr:MAG: hypothetical protein KatS3mg108_1035 [Isosphaeraceae bacterium]